MSFGRMLMGPDPASSILHHPGSWYHTDRPARTCLPPRTGPDQRRGRMADGKLSPKQETFVQAYVGAARFNASEAARIAGYKDPGQAGYILKKNEEIRARIDDVLAAHSLSSAEVLRELTDVAIADW